MTVEGQGKLIVFAENEDDACKQARDEDYTIKSIRKAEDDEENEVLDSLMPENTCVFIEYLDTNSWQEFEITSLELKHDHDILSRKDVVVTGYLNSEETDVGIMFPYWTSLEHDGPQMYVVYI